MGSILSAVVSLFAFRFRSRASLEIELIVVRHQLAVLRRQRPGRPQLSSFDRLLWVWLYRFWPQVIDAMVLVKPATVVQWHRKGFRFYWRWRSRRPGRPKIGTEIRAFARTSTSLRSAADRRILEPRASANSMATDRAPNPYRPLPDRPARRSI